MDDMDRFSLTMTGFGLSILLIVWLAIPASQDWRWTPVVVIVAAIPLTCLVLWKLRRFRKADR